jgi:hypothetical protein
MKVSGQLHATAASYAENETPVPTELEARWAPEPVWTLWVLSGIEPQHILYFNSGSEAK